MAKQKNSSGLVYSTAAGRMCPGCRHPVKECICKPARHLNSNETAVYISRQTKGRKGAGVTLITGLPLPPPELQALAKQLKKKCGVGGAVKEGVIELQGDQREVVKALLANRWTVKLSGG